MKTFKLQLLLIVFVPVSLFATIRTVSNSPSTIAQFNTIQLAVNASGAGDTIYVHGSPNVYASFTITDLRLVVMGPGFSPDKNLPFTATVQGCAINGVGSANTEIHGLTISSTINNQQSPVVNGLRFIRNHFININLNLNAIGTYSDYLFENNIFENSALFANPSSTYINFLIQNNYFYAPTTFNFTNFNNCVNVLFNHNLWFGPATGANDIAQNTSNRFLNFTNNIFVRRNIAFGVSSSTFTNNITFNAGTNNPWVVNSNVNGGGNIENQNPQMVDQIAVNAGTNNRIGDYTIAAGPANNTASDGKDMGLIYDATGSINFTNSRNSRLPRIFSMAVVNPTIAPGGTITVNVEARTSN